MLDLVPDAIAGSTTRSRSRCPKALTPRRTASRRGAIPVFSKPITNLKGMGVGSRVLRSAADYAQHYAPGHMWMALLDGRHVSSDVAVLDGAPVWWRHATGEPGVEGTFDHWTIHAEADTEIESGAGAWITEHLAGYTGMLNLETIGGRIIEVHLRFADQWPDLYGKGWVEALVRLYEHGRWDYPDTDRRDGYSVVLFGPHGPRYRHPPQSLVDEVRDDALRVERADHVSRGQAGRAACHAAGRISPRHRELFRPSAGRGARQLRSFFLQWAAVGRAALRAARSLEPCQENLGSSPMLTSRDRILTTHVGSLPRNDTITELLIKREAGEKIDGKQMSDELDRAVADVVKRQKDAGIDIGNDGEQQRVAFQTYMAARMSGYGGESKRRVGKDFVEHPDLVATFGRRFVHQRQDFQRSASHRGREIHRHGADQGRDRALQEIRGRRVRRDSS